MITRESLFALGIDPGVWADSLNDAMDRRDINTPDRQAMFVAQCAHESAGFRVLVENLNYSAAGLLETFPKYFTPEQAAACARNPERIANRVYANRMGNGDEASGDGWKYRGRGLIQITGADNYRQCGDAIGSGLVDSPGLLLDVPEAALSAAWFWQANGCNELADAGDFIATTRRINGGINGQADRELWLRKVREAMQ